MDMIEPGSVLGNRLSNQTPLYVSKRSFKNLWQAYRIYPDRIELQCWMAFHTLKIPLRKIAEIHIRSAFSIKDLFAGKRWHSFLGLKIDLADLCRHIAITKESRIMRLIAFTPDNPDEFADIMKLLKDKAGEIGWLLENQG